MTKTRENMESSREKKEEYVPLSTEEIVKQKESARGKCKRVVRKFWLFVVGCLGFTMIMETPLLGLSVQEQTDVELALGLILFCVGIVIVSRLDVYTKKLEDLKEMEKGQCEEVLEWFKKDVEVKRYVDEVKALGRMLTQKEYEMLKGWMKGRDQRDREQKQKDSCRELYGMPTEK